MKKAQGLSMNMIVIAAIALLILVVIVVIFTGQIGEKNRAINDCVTNGGTCQASCDGDYETQSKLYRCYQQDGKTPMEGQVCCVGI